MLALVIGTSLAIGALLFVLFPLFSDARPSRRAKVRTPARDRQQEPEAVTALREIEFDRETGKLSDFDYGELRARYTAQAIEAMRRVPAGGEGVDDVEAAVLAFRTRLRNCARCGPRPEPDAEYCSDCGSYLPGACASCGVSIGEPAAAFCSACGHQLAA